MTAAMNNQHHQAALAGLNNMYDRMQDSRIPATESASLGAIQAQATLALAYEQRTANLIALFGKTHPNGAGAFPHPMLEAAQREIQERLGF